jgi:hypothetical protein
MSIPLRLRRIVVAALVVLLAGTALGPALGTGVAHATPAAARADISTSRYPSVPAVARIFPAYRGGSIDFFPGRQFSTISDCVYSDLGSTQPRAGKTASYRAGGGRDAFFSGGTHVVVTLHDFRKPKRAQAALDEHRANVEACYGSNIDADGYGVTYTALAAPDLAQDGFAFRSITHDAYTGRDWFLTTFMRQGRFLVEARLQRDKDAPTTRTGFQLARAAVRAAS